jgi:hypothetical protein
MPPPIQTIQGQHKWLSTHIFSRLPQHRQAVDGDLPQKSQGDVQIFWSYPMPPNFSSQSVLKTHDRPNGFFIRPERKKQAGGRGLCFG